LSDLAPERTHRPQEPLVRLTQLPREELHDAHDTSRASQGKRERGVESATARRVGARKVRVVGNIDDPGRLSTHNDATGQADAGLERHLLAEGLELGRAGACMPLLDAAKESVRADLPHRTDAPA
jgi:hypothetical protein